MFPLSRDHDNISLERDRTQYCIRSTVASWISYALLMNDANAMNYTRQLISGNDPIQGCQIDISQEPEPIEALRSKNPQVPRPLLGEF